jgi:aspartate dehydrogenase
LKLAIIGYGSVARQTLSALANALTSPLDEIICLARPDGMTRASDMLNHGGERLARKRRVVTTCEEMLAARPSIVAEAAGHAALGEIGPAILSCGVDLVVTSVGALAHDDLRGALDGASARGGGRYLVCAGAVGGFDILSAAKLSGLTDVTYTSRKPPLAWRGTRAEESVNLGALREAKTFFRGDAGEAARQYPQNANVAATIALKGIGFARTKVELVADPAATRNVHEIRFRAACADVSITIEGNPSPENPKTSMTTGYALASQIIDLASRSSRRN